MSDPRKNGTIHSTASLLWIVTVSVESDVRFHCRSHDALFNVNHVALQRTKGKLCQYHYGYDYAGPLQGLES